MAEHRAEVLAGRVTWGKWRFVPDALVVEHDNGYYVDLERMSNSAGVLDWIAQCSHKARFTAEDIGQLVYALDELLDLQHRVCGWQTDRRFDARKILRDTSSQD